MEPKITARHDHIIASELSASVQQVTATVDLLDEGATVPFLARYRKEMTGGLDEVVITSIRDRVAQLRELDKRRAVIVTSLEEQGTLTDSLRAQVQAAISMTELEDLYLPYRPQTPHTGHDRQRTWTENRLAKILWAQTPHIDVVAEARKILNPDQGVETVEDSLGRRARISWPNGTTKISRHAHPYAHCF